MKKIYQNPAIRIVKINTAKMIAVSSVEMYGKNATGAGMSRDSGWWDDENED